MPAFAVQLRATLDGVSIMRPPTSMLRVKFQCGGCREEAEKVSVFSVAEDVPLPDGHGTAHLVQKCKNCNRTWIVSITGKDAAVVDESEVFKTVTVLDVRGATPVSAEPGEGYTITSESGARWENVDLSDADGFTEYDERAEVPVSVSEVEMKVIPAK